jgi:hypothetical protein
MHSAIHIDGIRRAPANRTVNVVRADTVKADSLSQSMHLMGAMIAYSPNSERSQVASCAASRIALYS